MTVARTLPSRLDGRLLGAVALSVMAMLAACVRIDSGTAPMSAEGLGLPEATAVAAATEVQPASDTGVYGSGIAADSKNNRFVHSSKLSHRFRASTTSTVQAIRFQQRGGPGHSMGDGGRMRVSLQPDDGTLAHRPTGEVLASVTFRPGNPRRDWTTFERYEFAEPPTLTRGALYHVVFENVGRTPEEDYISVNELFVFGGAASPRQPALSDDYAVLYETDGVWELSPQDTADMDIEYADGTRDGLGYIQNMCDLFGVVSGPTHRVREEFTVSGGDRTVTEAWVRVKRTFGVAPLTIALEAVDGARIDAADVPFDDVPLEEPGCTEGGAVWVSVPWASPHVLEDGSTYRLTLSTPSDTQYTADPIREGTDSGFGSYRFTDGGAERTTDGGLTWSPMYPWSPVDLQFYFR